MPELQTPEPPDSLPYEEAGDPPASLISRRLHDFFAEQGLARHKHSSQLAVILGLSRSGAFRKFQDGSFSAADLQSLARHFQVDVGELLSAPALDADGAAAQVRAARIFIGGRALACKATVGAELGPSEHCELVAVQQGQEWVVQPYGPSSAVQYRVHQMVIVPAQKPLVRLAVLEDSEDLAANLKEAFEAAGFRVEVFSSASELSRRSAEAPFDAYVVDWWLNGRTAGAVLQSVRKAQPNVPIVLTTGAIANGHAMEDDIVRVAMAHRIQVMEKPFRLGLLISQVKQLLGERS